MTAEIETLSAPVACQSSTEIHFAKFVKKGQVPLIHVRVGRKLVVRSKTHYQEEIENEAE